MKFRIILTMSTLLMVIIFLLGCNNNANNLSKSVFDIKEGKDDQIKILLYYDMEGLSGQNILTSIDFPRPEYFEARELLTADINAVIEGLFEGGVDSVFVVDAHGSFNPEPDVLLDKMDKRAKMLFKKERFHPYVDLLEENNYDAIVAVGMHSKTGGGGFAEHTVNLGTDWILNGMSINESELLAYSWGRIGVPLIFVSGDDKLYEQLRWMDWIEYVITKNAKGIADAELFPIEQVHSEMRLAAKRSIENLISAKYTKLTEPITARLRVESPADLSILTRVPGLSYENNSVTFHAPNFIEAYNGMRGLLDVAQSGYYNIAAELYLSQSGDSFMNFKEAVFQTWQETVNNRDIELEETTEQRTDEEQLYFGSR